MTMSASHQTPGALEGVRVLQLESQLTNYTGKLFAELGAEVILVEPPSAIHDAGKTAALTAGEASEPALKRAYFNTSKRSITLDLDTDEGRGIFRRLTKSSQLIIESFSPGLMKARGLDYASLSVENPELVMVSVTPFGQEGPYSRYQYEDITLLAMGGLLSLGGYADSEPIAAWGEQGYLAGNQFGAVAAMIALLEAETHGAGQHVDVSVQECIVMALENSVQFYELEGTIRKRYGGQQREAGSGVFSCKDGRILLLAGGIGATQFWGNFCRWLIEDGVEGAEKLQGDHWTPAYRKTPEAKALFEAVFVPYAMQHTKAQMYANAQAKRVPLCPLNDIGDVLENRQLEARGFFVDLDGHEAKSLRMPGAPYQLSETPWKLKSSAPLPGEDNHLIYTAAGYHPSDLEEFSRKGVI